MVRKIKKMPVQNNDIRLQNKRKLVRTAILSVLLFFVLKSGIGDGYVVFDEIEPIIKIENGIIWEAYDNVESSFGKKDRIEKENRETRTYFAALQN